MNRSINKLRLPAFNVAIFLCCLSVCLNAAVYNPPERMKVIRPTFENNTERLLRYYPDGTDFVIENGKEFFNRPLYGGNRAFRVDAGDKPEFSLYLPGHGGNLRFGVRTAGGVKWLNDADTIVSRYRPGAMLYEIRDDLFRDAALYVSVMGLYDDDGLIVEVRLQGSEPIELIAAFGGAGGKRGKRSGDIGCESEPVSQFFQLKPENCKGNNFTINKNNFLLKGPRGSIAGVFPEGAVLAEKDAEKLNTIGEFLTSTGESVEYPILASVMTLSPDTPAYIALKRVGDKIMAFEYKDLVTLYQQAEQKRRKVAQHVSVKTPDPFINAAASALCVATDAIWDEKQGSVMHGAVAWRSKYLGWRGPYTNDAFGWHDRAKRHLTYWAGQQDTRSVPDKILPADPTAHLARNEPSLHSNGALSHKHYDMNLVYMDALIRHLLWTGDMELAEELWPLIERHMAWEQRLFRRPFGEDKLPLYEAYAAIWASDDLQYNGGGVTHASAYNYYHNLMVARFAKELGKDPAPYEQEAELIKKAMNKYLWLPRRGWYAEYKDLLGLQATHPSAALWTFYHTLDSEAADPLQAWQMSRFVDTQIAHIPVYGGDIPKGRYFTLPTTNWMPYTWSTNNVVMAEAEHTALAYWQAQRPDKAYELFKGCILDSMYMGKCPGNAGMTTYFDMARGEAQRDFGDAIGTCSRALIEGLFGVKPDILKGQLTIAPGFPDDWEYAGLEHPDLTFDYRRDGQMETYSIKPLFPKPLSLRLRIRARTTRIEEVIVNGESMNWISVQDAVGCPSVQIDCDPCPLYNVRITWEGTEPANAQSHPTAAKDALFKVDFGKAKVLDIINPQDALEDVKVDSHSLSGIAVGMLGHRSIFVGLEQGEMTWQQPVNVEIRKPFEIIAEPQVEEDSIEFKVQNNTARAINAKAMIKVGTEQAKVNLKIPPYGLSWYIPLSAKDFRLLPGSNRVQIELDNGVKFDGIVTNWHLSDEHLRDNAAFINLGAVYNDSVTQIFKNEYLSPRSPYCSLAIPKQGIGSWCNFSKTFDIDDRGLRDTANNNDGFFKLPQGVRFKVPVASEANNIVFVSQWDNYPDTVTINVGGKARHLYLLMAGSTNSMQSQFDNGEVIVTYSDGSAERLALRNPTTWWPIDQDYFIDDFGFNRPEPIPLRVDLKTGQVRILDVNEFKGKGGTVPGGAATVLDLPLNAEKQLQSIRLRALANEVVIGLMSATLVK